MDILDQLKLQADERVAQYADKMRCESQLEGAFVHACMAVINNRRLSTCDSNRAMLESLLNPGEMPSPKIVRGVGRTIPDSVHLGHSSIAADEGRATCCVR